MLPPFLNIFGDLFNQPTYHWRALSDDEKVFLSGFFDVRQVMEKGGDDSEMVSAILGEFEDFEHNGNRPWNGDIAPIYNKLVDVMHKLRYYLVLEFRAERYR